MIFETLQLCSYNGNLYTLLKYNEGDSYYTLEEINTGFRMGYRPEVFKELVQNSEIIFYSLRIRKVPNEFI